MNELIEFYQTIIFAYKPYHFGMPKKVLEHGTSKILN
jgi:hypothetical protein